MDNGNVMNKTKSKKTLWQQEDERTISPRWIGAFWTRRN